MKEKMNELILRLAEQAGFEIDCCSLEWHKRIKRFAELIVWECAESANDWYQNHDKIHSDPMSYVLAHFGVEE